MKLHMRHVSSKLFLVSSVGLLGACSQNTPVSVQFEFRDSVKVMGRAASSPTYIEIDIHGEGAFASPVSSTGLIKNRMCYLVHVTGPGLDTEGTRNNDTSCPASPRAVGKIFGPFKYGTDASIQVSAGSDRRFDLIGFINPYSDDPDCSKHTFRSELLSSFGHPVLRLSYGKYLIDSSTEHKEHYTIPNAPLGKLMAFAVSPVVALSVGSKNVVPLDKVPWDTSKSKPISYGCHGSEDGDGDGDADVISHNTTFPPLNFSKNNNIPYILTGMADKAFLEVKCPQNYTGDLSLTFNDETEPYEAIRCSANQRIIYSNIDLLDIWKLETNETCHMDKKCIDFELTTDDETVYLSGQFILDSRYSSLVSETNDLVITDSSTYYYKFLGYNYNNSTNTAYIKGKSYNSFADFYSVDITDKTGNSSELIGFGNYLDLVFSKAKEFFGLFQDTSKTPKEVIFRKNNTPGSTVYTSNSILDHSMVTENDHFVTLPNNTNQFNVTTGENGVINLDNHGLYDNQSISVMNYENCKNITGTFTIKHIDNNSFKIKNNSNEYVSQKSAPPICSITLSVYTAKILTESSSQNYFIHEDLANNPETLQGPVIDFSGDQKHIAVWTNEEKISYTCQECPTSSLINISNKEIYSIDIVKNKLFVLVNDFTNNKTELNSYELFELNSNPPTSTNKSHNFYPSTPTGSSSGIIKWLRHTDSGINDKNQGLIYIQTKNPDTLANENGYLYRTRDAGANWYLVKIFESHEEVLDIQPIYLTPEKAGFALLVKTVGQLKIYTEDSQHGF